MIGLVRSGLLAMVLAATAIPAHAGQLCGWLVESLKGDNVHQFELWLQAEGDTEVFYRMAGRGIVTEPSGSHAPSRGTYALRNRLPVKVWGFGSALNAPADIDVVAEIYAPPPRGFADRPTPLLAKFSFQRRVSADEGEAGQPFASRQCATVAAP